MDRAHPDLTFSLLPWVLDSMDDDGAGWEIFRTGVARLCIRYRELGLTGLLPIDRVWVGVRSALPEAFGGFHYPDQGYRHRQMGAVITRYGDLTSAVVPAPELVALDLLRSYAHDCLHYGTYREYRLWDGQIIRTRYGINGRDRQGRTYSAPDRPGTVSTRNLGIVMEGATDHEARGIARWAAEGCGVAEPGSDRRLDRVAFGDITGRPVTGSAPEGRYAGAVTAYERQVGIPYRGFLREIGAGEADALHDLVLRGMVRGRRSVVGEWLDVRRGGGAFRALFRAGGRRLQGQVLPSVGTSPSRR
ncbi:hypothetical protein [Streptomyces xiamenensis]|uniref:hypothetical protein n=1 Tax=Streptomyces xiamenensis TaxID=408015 RepID=UPI0037D46C94